MGLIREDWTNLWTSISGATEWNWQKIEQNQWIEVDFVIPWPVTVMMLQWPSIDITIPMHGKALFRLPLNCIEEIKSNEFKRDPH